MPKYRTRRVTDNGDSLLEVVNQADQIVFRMPLNYQLVFATISKSKLWVLEQTPYPYSVSNEIDLETGQAQSYRSQDGSLTLTANWSYDKETDSWNLAT